MFELKTERHNSILIIVELLAQNNFTALVIAAPFPVFLIFTMLSKDHFWCGFKQAQSTPDVSQLSFPFFLCINIEFQEL